MSLRQALEKLRNDSGKEFQQDPCNGDVKLDLSEFDDFDFDLNSEFFEQDEYFGTPVSKEPQLSNSRVPLMQVCNKTPLAKDKSDQGKSNTPLSSQKLKTFAFSRSKLKDVDKPPSKRPALERDLSDHRTPVCSSLSLNISSSNAVPHIIDTSPTHSSTVRLPDSSHITPTCHTRKTSTHNSHHDGLTSLPVTSLSSRPTPLSCHCLSAKRKFPGPAGLLPKLLPNQSLEDVNISLPGSPGFTPRSKVTTLANLLPSSQDEGCDFTGTVWKTAMEELPSITKGSQEVFSVARLTKEASHKRLVLGKVPFLVAMLKSVAPQGNGACVVLKDPTGEIPGTLHARVYETYQKELIPGTVLTLQKVSVFSPSQRRKYLNITLSNIIKLYLHTGSTVVNEQAAEIDTVNDGDVTHSSVTNGTIINTDMLFNTDIDEEDWCGLNPNAMSDHSNQVTLNTLCTRDCAAISTSFIPVSNSSVNCGNQRDFNGVQNHCVLPQFTDGLEDEDLDKLLQDFEEDQLICT